jgi:hypothetical protein
MTKQQQQGQENQSQPQSQPQPLRMQRSITARCALGQDTKDGKCIDSISEAKLLTMPLLKLELE